jgi:hypothetical protein
VSGRSTQRCCLAHGRAVECRTPCRPRNPSYTEAYRGPWDGTDPDGELDGGSGWLSRPGDPPNSENGPGDQLGRRNYRHVVRQAAGCGTTTRRNRYTFTSRRTGPPDLQAFAIADDLTVHRHDIGAIPIEACLEIYGNGAGAEGPETGAGVGVGGANR